MKLFLFCVLLYSVNEYFKDSPEPISSENTYRFAHSKNTAREIDSSCDIVVFTTPSCPYCKKAKNLLNSKNIDWCEKDISRSAENYKTFKSLGGKGVPVLVSGDRIIKGFNQKKYSALLENI